MVNDTLCHDFIVVAVRIHLKRSIKVMFLCMTTHYVRYTLIRVKQHFLLKIHKKN